MSVQVRWFRRYHHVKGSEKTESDLVMACMSDPGTMKILSHPIADLKGDRETCSCFPMRKPGLHTRPDRPKPICHLRCQGSAIWCDLRTVTLVASKIPFALAEVISVCFITSRLLVHLIRPAAEPPLPHVSRPNLDLWPAMTAYSTARSRSHRPPLPPLSREFSSRLVSWFPPHNE